MWARGSTQRTFLFSVYPASKMIGGSSRKKKISGWKLSIFISACEGCASLATPPTTTPIVIAAADSGMR